MTTRIMLLDVASASVCHGQGDPGESLGVIKCLGGTQELLKVVQLKGFQIETGPICGKPTLQLLEMDEVLSGHYHRIEDLLSRDRI